MKKWYERLFTNYARTYDTECFTQGTVQETGFIEREIRFNRKVKILDVGCGTGRHSIELARRGYDVTGLDLSENQLSRAREKAEAAGVRVNFVRGDARKFSFREKFGLVIMLCEGGFSLMGTDEENFAILKCCSRALKKDGKLILNALNALFPLNHNVKDFLNKDSKAGPTTKLTFDWITLRERLVLKAKDDDGRKMTIKCDERYFMPSEISWYLKSLGFRKIGILGCDVGHFSRKKRLTPENFQLMAIATR